MHLLTFFAGLWSKSAGDTGPLDLATQKLQLGKLLVVAMARASAEIGLPDCNGLLPFGLTLSRDGRIRESPEVPQTDGPPDTETAVFELANAAQRGITACQILAYAVVSGMRLIPIGRFERTNTIVVDLRHRDGLSFTVYHPYRLDVDRQITIERPFLSAGPAGVHP